jgi:hypothetical protein
LTRNAQDRDKFGFRLGTKRALAARLYENGATQSEMIAATGTTQYNMLKEAELRGHRVIRRDDRHWLIHASDAHALLAHSAASRLTAEIPVQQRAASAVALGRAKRPLSEGLPICPAILSVIGWHGTESPSDIVRRKAEDVERAGVTLWVYQSWKANVREIQVFACLHPHPLVYFLEGSAVATGTAQRAREMSEDRISWRPIPEGIGKVTGKLTGGAAMILGELSPVANQTLDLWQFFEHRPLQSLRFQRGGSTACAIPAPAGPIEGMKSRYRQVAAIGRLVPPYAVFLR